MAPIIASRQVGAMFCCISQWGYCLVYWRSGAYSEFSDEMTHEIHLVCDKLFDIDSACIRPYIPLEINRYDRDYIHVISQCRTQHVVTCVYYDIAFNTLYI